MFRQVIGSTRVHQLFEERFGSPPHDWQMDVTEAMLLDLDSIVIAGTSAGKTMPFMMPLLLELKSKCIIISPFKVLQEDQVRCSYLCFSLMISLILARNFS